MTTNAKDEVCRDLSQATRGNFEDLFYLENKALDDQRLPVQKKWRILTTGMTEEPWVTFAEKDRVGLALSGGGIRSATFNLGILQALKKNHITHRVHYLSTVSGGGYIGGFWTRWRQWRRSPQATIKIVFGGAESEVETGSPAPQPQQRESEAKDFPQSGVMADGDQRPGPKDIREPDEFRHLREFSRFLIPRNGLNAEFWSVISSLLTGLVPSLIAALATVFFSMALWVLSAAALIRLDGHWTVGFFAGILAATLVVAEVVTRLSGRLAVCSSRRSAFTASYALWSFFAVVSVIAWMEMWPMMENLDSLDPSWYENHTYLSNGSIFAPSVVLLGALALLTVMRMVWGRFHTARVPTADADRQTGNGAPKDLTTSSAALEHVMARILAFLTVWAVLAGVWEIARWLNMQAIAQDLDMMEKTGGLSGLTAVLALLFYWARRWLTQPKKDNLDLTLLDRLKPFVERILASAVVLLMFILASVFILNSNFCDRLWPDPRMIFGCVIILMVVLLLFDPVKFGQHDFYRARLARCYLGAGRQRQSDNGDCQSGQNNLDCNRESVERPGDDMFLCEDTGLPIHLICCAANQLCGDPLSTLHRGARSAVLSRFGIALGDHWIADKSLRLSSALTASAAALNSLMGELSMQFGRAVSFVLTALNFRLGLWVRNPACPIVKFKLQRWCPGWFFIKELLGWAQCRTDSYAGAYMHLSDGGHFENLALYELIRRHCRYIIVSDAGEDRQFECTDFGRAIRRVREDFGVEIEIDLAPMRPKAEGISQQHIAVGVIHYNGVMGMDKGTIVYFKPTLTGDEPVDVQQYSRRSPLFPHESTLDQFFDEAQFEAYRCLGEHAANDGLRVLERTPGDSTKIKDETLFRKIRLHWHRVPWMEGDAGIRLCEHAADLENTLRDQASATVRREFIRDILTAKTTPLMGDSSDWVESAVQPGGGQIEAISSPNTQAARVPAEADQTVRDVLLALRAFKLMEEAWVTCDLERYATHPLAQSWMSYLQRWAAMPTLKKWWPVLRSLFGDVFQAFVDIELHMQSVKTSGLLPTFKFNLSADPPLDRLKGYAWRRFQECDPSFALKGHKPFSLELQFFSEDSREAICLQVGLALIKIDATHKLATWEMNNLFVPPELAGGGFHDELLKGVIHHFERGSGTKKVVAQLEVRLGEVPLDKELDKEVKSKQEMATVAAHQRYGHAGRQARLELIDFYRSQGFVFKSGEEQNNRMVRELDAQVAGGFNQTGRIPLS